MLRLLVPGGTLRFRARVHVVSADGVPVSDGCQAHVAILRHRKSWTTAEADVDGGVAIWDEPLDMQLTVKADGGQPPKLSPKEYSFKIVSGERTAAKALVDMTAYLSLEPSPPPRTIEAELHPEGTLTFIVSAEWLLEGHDAAAGSLWKTESDSLSPRAPRRGPEPEARPAALSSSAHDIDLGPALELEPRLEQEPSPELDPRAREELIKESMDLLVSSDEESVRDTSLWQSVARRLTPVTPKASKKPPPEEEAEAVARGGSKGRRDAGAGTSEPSSKGWGDPGQGQGEDASREMNMAQVVKKMQKKVKEGVHKAVQDVRESAPHVQWGKLQEENRALNARLKAMEEALRAAGGGEDGLLAELIEAKVALAEARAETDALRKTLHQRGK
mmetsp:Transcript_13486/g.38333  ORF Transcript_13486/g.38333 Transcript_13486/m.38333 type:complete len:389 (+) Transcript_13486:17-1183(+)